MRILLAAASYFIGSFPTGYVLYRIVERQDIRRFGSRATGATNMLRLKGLKFALPVALIDMIKGGIPAMLAFQFFNDPGFAAQCASLAVIGHCFPFAIGFKGGKGVATAAGAMFALAPLPAAFSLGAFVLTVALTRFVSLGSMLATVLFPVFGLILKAPLPLLLWSGPIVLLILVRHRDNINRLIEGSERRIGAPRKENPS